MNFFLLNEKASFIFLAVRVLPIFENKNFASILNPGSENSMNVLLAGRDIPKRQNVSMRSDNMQVRAHIQQILTPKDLPRNKNFPLDSSDIDLEYFENLQKKKSPQQSLFFTSNALEDEEIFSCPGKFKFKCVQKKKY